VNILSGTPFADVRNLQVGQQGNAVLGTPVILSGGTIADSRNGISVTASGKTTQEREEQFVVRLKPPLVDGSGQILLPGGSYQFRLHRNYIQHIAGK
jgi:hypothetical protein